MGVRPCRRPGPCAVRTGLRADARRRRHRPGRRLHRVVRVPARRSDGGQRAGRGVRETPSGPGRRVRRDRPVGGRLGPRRGRGRRARAVRCGAVAVQAAADAGRPADGADLRAVRGPRRSRPAAHRDQLVAGRGLRRRAPPVRGRRRHRVPGPEDRRAARGVAVGRGHDDGDLAARERVRGPVRAPAAHVRPAELGLGTVAALREPAGCRPGPVRLHVDVARSAADLAAEVRELPLHDDVLDKWLGGNALRLLDRG